MRSIYEAFFERSRDAVLLARSDGTIVRANPAACLALGRSEDELRREGLQVDGAPLRELLARLDDAVSFTREATVGDALVVELTAGAIPSDDGGALTYLILRERRRRAPGTLLKGLTDAVADPIFLKDRDGRWIFANQAALRLLGTSLRAIIGKRDREILADPWVAAASTAADQRVMASGVAEAQEETFSLPDGARVFLTARSPFRNHGGQVIGVVACARDITDRKRAEDELATQRRLLTDIIDGTPALICAYDREGRLSVANRAAALAPEVARSFDTLHAEVMAAGKPQVVELSVLLPGGERSYVAARYPLRDGQGRIYGTATIATDVTEQKRTEAALRDSEARLKQAQRNARIGSWRHVAGGALQWSEQMYALFGLPADTPPTPQAVLAAVHPDDRAAYVAAFANALDAAASDFTSEYRVVWPDGQLRVLHTVGQIRREPDGALAEAVGTVQDVTELKRSEAEARRAAQRLKILADASQAFAAAGHDLRALVAALEAQVVAALADECTVTVGRDEPARDEPHEVVVSLSAGGGAVGSLAMRRHRERPPFTDEDVSLALELAGRAAVSVEGARAEADRERLARAIEQVAETVVVTDAQGTIVYANPAFEAVTGYTRAEAVGSNPRILKSGAHDAAFYRAMWDTLRAGDTWQGRLVNRRKDGSLYTEDATISPVRDAGGVTTAFVAVKRDISRELAVEAMVAEAQRMESIGLLAGGVAHDFNNSLSVILACTGFVQTDLPPDHPVRGDILEIERAARQAGALTRQLLAFGRKQVLQPEPVELNRVLAEMDRMLHRILGEDIELVLRLAPDLGIVTADPSQIEQVVMNLVVNARDAMPRGGTLTIETHDVELDADHAVAHAGARAGPHVMVAVSDTGAGMDPATVARIFEPFFTTKAPGRGTGLGLSTVYGIVKQSGGSIHVYSEPGAGTTFKVYLPRDPERRPARARTAAATRAGGSETILLVEDDDAVRKVTRRILEAAGYTVLPARDAADGLRIAGAHAATIHLALTDVVMPVMGGRAFAERLATLRPHTRVLYMSGYTDDAILQHGVLDGRAPFIAKPLTDVELLRKVREVLDG